ncbi:MAG: phosphoribosylglycinamide formyltransferase [Bdellovibrionales bacterium]|nr:phosphoribosylglycinamide formyltransferase [Bdellovibrionales bacterium]
MERQPNSYFRVVVLISGRGSNLRALVEASLSGAAPYRIVGVLSDKGDAAGLTFAAEHGIPTSVVPRRPKSQDAKQFNKALAEAAAGFQPDLIVLAGFMRILGSEFIGAFPNRIINIHPSLLPAFPGLHVQQQALDAGVKFSGATVHLVVEEVDAGPILAQAVVPVLPGDNAELLAARILRQEHRLLPAVVRRLACGDLRIEVNESGTTVITDSQGIAAQSEFPSAADALRSIE